MGYVEDNLLPNEKVLFRGKISNAIYLGPGLMFILSIILLFLGIKNYSSTDVVQYFIFLLYFFAFLFFFIYSLTLFIRYVVMMFTTEFAVTNRRIIAKRGFIRRHSMEMLLHKVESISISQNVLQRLFNFGSVTIVGTGGTRERFSAIVEPVEVKNKVNLIIERYMQAYQDYLLQQKH